MAAISDTNHRQVIVAALAATAVVFVTDVAYRTLAARATTAVTHTPVDPAALRRFPLQIDSWTGMDVPLDEATERATGTDAHLNRRYSRYNGLESVGLYVASGGNARALVAHRPEVCYIAGGYALVDRHSLSLMLRDGSILPCSVFQFSHGGFNSDRRTMLYYYIVDGQYCGDVSSLRSKVWRGSDRVNFAVQVQINASMAGTQTADSGTKLVSAFAVDSAPLVHQLFVPYLPAPNSRAVGRAD